jgi:hypothetical protein
MINCAAALFVQEPEVKDKDVAVLMEITMNNLLAAGKLDAQDFLARADLLTDIGFTVLISNYNGSRFGRPSDQGPAALRQHARSLHPRRNQLRYFLKFPLESR